MTIVLMVASCHLLSAARSLRRGRTWLCVGLFAGLTAFVGAAEPIGSESPSTPAPLLNAAEFPVIDSIEEYWRPEAREISRPIKMEVLIDYYEGGWNHLWGRTNALPGYLPCATSIPIASHDLVLIEGTVVPRKGLSADTAKFTILQHDVPYTPIQVNGPTELADFTTLRSRIVTFEAMVERQWITPKSPNHLQMNLVAGPYRVRLFQWDPNAKLLDLKQGSRVRMTGVYVPKFDPQSSTLEIDMWVPKREDIVVIGDLDTDPKFEGPAVPIETLPNAVQTGSHSLHVIGKVRSYVPGQSVVLRDETGEVRARTLQTLPLLTGEWVEAVGDPYLASSDWLLRTAVVRPASADAVANVKGRQAGSAQTLRLADQVQALSPAEAAKGLPAELMGVITWSDPDANFWYLQDSSGGVRVQMEANAGKDFPLQGQIRLKGTTRPGVFASQLREVKMEVLGSVVLPPPERITFDQAMSGAYEGRRVELNGLVQRVAEEGGFMRLFLSTPTGTFSVLISRAEEAKGLVGSIISVHGICQAVANHRRQLTSIEILLNSRDDIRLEHPPLIDPFAEPLRKIGALRQFRVNSAVYDWARVKGVVTHVSPGHAIILQDGNEGLTIYSEQSDPVAVGDVIEATGLPGLEQGHVILREAVYRKLDHRGDVEPTVVTKLDEVAENFDNLLARVSGTLLSSAQDGQGLNLSIQSDKTVFTASLPLAARNSSERWTPGSRLEVTGVYQVMRDERKGPLGFRLLLRSEADVMVLEHSSWWTPGRAVVVTALLLGCIALGLTWVAALRRRVSRQTGQIRDQILKETKLEAHNRAIVANANDCIFTTDLAGNFTSLNPAGERLLGYDQAEILRLNVRGVIDPAGKGSGPDFFSTLSATEVAAARFELRLVTKDGRRIWTEINACLIHTESRAVGLLGVVRDIGERKQIEEELKRARDAAQANTEAKSAFLANMSHEIRTPMNGVIGMSNLLLETRLTEDQREYTETVRNSAEALLTVLNDILDFSKIEAGKLEIESVDFDVVNCVKESLDLLAARASAKGLELALYVAPDIPRQLRGDPGRLRQVLLNLAGNAVKFTDQGEVTISVVREPSVDGAVALRFEVRDTGVGLSPEEISRLFRPFSQADTSTTRRFGGTGLGLAISKQIVELLQGQIGVESTPREGSCFHFTARFARQPTRTSRPFGLPDVERVRVLYHGRNTSTRRFVAAYFQAWGVRSDFVVTPAQAHEAAEKAKAAGEAISVILVDRPMVEKNVCAVANAVRTHPALQNATLVLLDSMDRRSMSDTGESLTHLVIKKPLHPDELKKIIINAVQPREQPVSESPASSHSAQVSGIKTKEEPEASPTRLLVAEDNTVNQRVVLLQLKKLGYSSKVVNNGTEVLAALRAAPYDIILMDCQMPEMDGYQVTQIIKQDPQLSKLHIIAMTANAMQGDREKCLAAGMDDYVTKPLRLDDLRGALVRAQEAVALLQAK